MRPERSFQGFILALQRFWADQGCVILQPYDMEMGAGTFHPATTLRALGPRPWKAAYVQPSRRPKDGRYGENPNRLQHYYQFQVIIKPSPPNLQELYLASRWPRSASIPNLHDIRFVEDDWESPTLGAWGLGWECWCDGMEVSQFTYFQQVAGVECAPVAGELTYGLERLAMYVQGVDRVYDLNFNGRDGAEKVSPMATCSCRPSRNIPGIISNMPTPTCCSSNSGWPKQRLQEISRGWMEERLANPGKKEHLMALPAYDQCIKASHVFNLLDARGVISVTERAKLHHARARPRQGLRRSLGPHRSGRGGDCWRSVVIALLNDWFGEIRTCSPPSVRRSPWAKADGGEGSGVGGAQAMPDMFESHASEPTAQRAVCARVLRRRARQKPSVKLWQHLRYDNTLVQRTSLPASGKRSSVRSSLPTSRVIKLRDCDRARRRTAQLAAG